MVVVQGTDHDTLKKGPGHYVKSGLPGEGGLIYIAGHRTTYLAPFAYIDGIKDGDYVTLEVPYGTFSYRVTAHNATGDGATTPKKFLERTFGVPPEAQHDVRVVRQETVVTT